jgi:ribonuclease HI
MPEAKVLTIHTDGASRGNPGAAAYAYVIECDGEILIEEAGCLGEMTNNQAEYTALVKALEHALEFGPEHRVIVHSDSELMVKQMNGQYKVKNAELRPLYEEARDLARQFQVRVTIKHVRREQNRRADQLCNEALDGLRVPMPRAPRPAAPVSRAAPAVEPREARDPELPFAVSAKLEEEALGCLRRAADAWQRGEDRPTPEAVWRQLLEVLQEHGLEVK